MLRYYPLSKIVTNLISDGSLFLDSKGKPYTGRYYMTYDGKAYSGPSPQVGPSEKLTERVNYPSVPMFKITDAEHQLGSDFSEKEKLALAAKTGLLANRQQGKPVSYYPTVLQSDYNKGYVMRCFTKKINENLIIEISEDEHDQIVNGTANYDIKPYQTTKIMWKLTGPLRSQRRSQYNIIPGIIETNQRLTEQANKTFLGITEYIGGEYDKFARPTA